MPRRALLALMTLVVAASAGAAEERAYAIEDTSYTIEPGRYAIEITPLTFARRDGDVDTETWSFGYTLVRAGIAPDTEVGFAFESWMVAHAQEPSTGARERLRGTGNVALRLKQNVLGNDGGRASLAFTPHVRLPTGGRVIAAQCTEWGFAIPADFILTENWTTLLVTYGDWLGNSSGTGRHFESSLLLDFSRTFATDWLALFECYYQVCPESGAAPVGTLNVGVGRTWSGNVYAEIGAMFGLTQAADDVTGYVSLGHRF